MIHNIGVYLTVITAIIAAYLTYRNQLRLKSFELLYERRVLVLKDIESFLNDLYRVQTDLGANMESENIQKYLNEYFHEGLILMHKVQGANFGELVDKLIGTFWSVLIEPVSKGGSINQSELKSWISRTINGLSAVYGLSHRQLTNELERMAFSPITRLIKKHKNKSKINKDKS